MAHIIVILISGGMLGALAAAYVKSPPNQSLFNGHVIRRVVEGSIASLALPVLFHIVGTELISEALMDNSRALQLFGYSLLAGFFARRFLEDLASKALQAAKEAKEVAMHADDKAEKVEESVDQVLWEEDFQPEEPQKIPISALDHNEYAVIKALTKGVFTFRTIQGIAQETGKPVDHIEKILMELKKRRFVNRIEKKKGVRWYATATGRRAIGEDRGPGSLTVED